MDWIVYVEACLVRCDEDGKGRTSLFVQNLSRDSRFLAMRSQFPVSSALVVEKECLEIENWLRLWRDLKSGVVRSQLGSTAEVIGRRQRYRNDANFRHYAPVYSGLWLHRNIRSW